MAEPLVIIGAGQAGGRAALTLREAGHEGLVVLLGAEAAAPYERPPLSKDYLAGGRDRASLAVASAEALREAGIDFRPATVVEAIDRAAHEVVLEGGERLAYGKLLLATGREPRRLPVPEDVAPHARVLRDLDDADALRTRLARGSRLAIIGGGFIGLEVAATARARGVEVTVIELLPRLLARTVPEPLAAKLQQRHEAAGVDIRLGRRIEGLRAAGEAVRLVLDDGHEIVADTLLVGIGAVPRTGLAEAAGLAVEGGILVDATLRTSDPDIYAAGDVTAFAEPRTGTRQRLESWDNAEAQGALAARNMLGAGEALDRLPWFWSDQYELTLQMAGQMAGQVTGDGAVIERRIGDDGLVLFHLDEAGRIAAVSALGPSSIAKEFKLAQRLAEGRKRVDPASLEDPKTSLKALLRRGGDQ